MRLLPLAIAAPLWSLAAASGAAQETPWPGQTLFHPLFDTTSYLIDVDGNVVHSWPASAQPAASIYYMGDGELLRTQNLSGTLITGEGLELVGWDGAVLWSTPIGDSDLVAHHDIEPMPNGNVLVVYWDIRTADEAIAAGRDPTLLTTGLFAPEAILELRPTPPTGAEVVWEWYLWDHLVQDFDPTAANFGVVADHPERVDINFPPQSVPANGDWNHFNAIDYNAELDQILLSPLFQREIWIIDHSTTTEEAAGHSGGNCGKGGDLIYRWGNPQAYDRGTPADQTLFGTHDTNWIPEGLPGAGHILLFNNGFDRPEGEYSTADEIVPPMTFAGCYELPPGEAYGPSAATWVHTEPNPTDLYTPYMGGARRLPDGNTLIVDADDARFLEVTEEGDTVWEYVSPYPGGGADDRVFRASRLQVCLRPETYCTPSPNSVGPGAEIGFAGSFSVSANELVLDATGCPPGQPALFYYGSERTRVPFGDGSRCVGGETVRLLPAGNVGPDGTVSYPADLSGPPATGGEIDAGTTWNFQLWYRDPDAMGAGFNLSDAMAATFCP